MLHETHYWRHSHLHKQRHQCLVTTAIRQMKHRNSKMRSLECKMMDITCVNHFNLSRRPMISIREEAYQVKEGSAGYIPKEWVRRSKASSVLELPKVLRDWTEYISISRSQSKASWSKKMLSLLTSNIEAWNLSLCNRTTYSKTCLSDFDY